jgi:small-conductance mechanosensitive channel
MEQPACFNHVSLTHSHWSPCHRLASSNHIAQGDLIQLHSSSGTGRDVDSPDVTKPTTTSTNVIQGVVVQLGWTRTLLRQRDDSLISIPNTVLAQGHYHNLSSRLPSSRVHQQLRFHYKDAARLPNILKSIKEEIRLGCPSLILNHASLPFRVHWTSFDKDYLEVVVEAHFSIPSSESLEYWDNRQRVLQAINRATKIHQVDFAVKDVSSSTKQPTTIGHRAASQ